MDEIPDGTYDVFIVDADAAGEGLARFEVTFTSGPNKGAVVAVVGPSWEPDPVLLLGLPARLEVRAGVPRLAPDR